MELSHISFVTRLDSVTDARIKYFGDSLCPVLRVFAAFISIIILKRIAFYIHFDYIKRLSVSDMILSALM